jgi:3-dehydroquinate synthase II
VELWIDDRVTGSQQSALPVGFDQRIGEAGLTLEGHKINHNGNLFGAYIHIGTASDQAQATSLIGSVGWLLVSFSDWSMIPIENLIAAAEGTPTKIATLLDDEVQIQGAAFALEKGVDAIAVAPQRALIEAAQIAKSQRLERHQNNEPLAVQSTPEINLEAFTITAVEEGGLGERYCIDFTSLLVQGEGMLVGSNASSFMLVHGETIPSEFVPIRPFRVNAGSPQSYTMMADGSTKYLSELSSGDTVTVANAEGMTRNVTVGRLKIERRPMLLFRWLNENHKEGHIFLQQAETVRAVGTNGTPMSVTSLAVGNQILGCFDVGARHIGVAISSAVQER